MVKPESSGLGSKKKTGKAGINQHEQELADKLGGRRQPASGALAHKKGDVSLGDDSIFAPDRFLLDSKETVANSIIVSGLDLTKITREATEADKTPGMILTIGQVALGTPREWVMIPLPRFQELLEQLRNDGN